MRSTKTSYNEFLRFMSVEVKNIEAIKLPEEKKIKKLANINVTSTFGSAGSLLSSLASGALDAAGLVGNFFGGGAKKNPKAGRAIPKGKGIRLGGIRALGIANVALAGLDFAQGLQEGEGVGKAAAGAGGNLAGSLIGGAIGQALVPIPGLGFVLGSMAGGMLGGYLGDRGYEAATGGGNVKEKTKSKLKAQEQKQKSEAAASLTSITFPQVLDKFDTVVTQFQRAVANLSSDVPQDQQWEQGETGSDKIDYRPKDAEEFTPGAPTGAGDEVFPLVGGKPTFTMGPGLFNASRDGGARRHSAQDIGVDPNTPVVASRSGTVLQAYSSGYGSVGGAVVIRYDNGQQGLYGHTLPVVKVGDKVKAGQKIARVAPEGNNTHLHYMRKDTRGNYIDPLPILKQSKSGVPVVQGQKQESKKDLEKQSNMSNNTGDAAMATPQNKMISKSSPQTAAAKPVPTQQDLSKMSTDQLRGMLDPTKTAASNPAVFKAAQEARTKGQESGLTGDDLERAVMIASIRAKNAESQIAAMSQQPVLPQQIQQYPQYNLPQSTVTVIPMMMGGPGGGSQQRPMVVSSGGGGGTTIMPSVPTGQVLNSLFNTMLLTSLSGT
jgi:murein DD-endopeptidase MepM/ murein hydrolase activator NlpD